MTCITVISLKRSKDRRDFINKQFAEKQVKYKFFDAVDMADTSCSNNEIFDKDAFQRLYKRRPSPAEIGNILSQTGAMKEFLLNLTRLQKRLLLILVDAVTISLALWLSLSIRQDSFFNFSDGYELTGATSLNLYSILLLANVTIITSLILFRLYRSITRYISIETYVKITKASIIGTGLWALIIYGLHLPFPRSGFIIFFIIF